MLHLVDLLDQAGLLHLVGDSGTMTLHFVGRHCALGFVGDWLPEVAQIPINLTVWEINILSIGHRNFQKIIGFALQVGETMKAWNTGAQLHLQTPDNLPQLVLLVNSMRDALHRMPT
jgi:hypothetical protein